MSSSRRLGWSGLVLLALTSCKTAPTAPPVVVSSDPPAAPAASPPAAPPAPPPPAAPRQVRVVEGVTEYALANGMQVLLFPDNSKDTVTVNVTYLVGSRHEGYGETGMAHLLEHMLFKGSTNVSDLDAQLKKRGATYNASTWFDRTNYYETMPANADNVSWALRMEADRMVNALIRQEDLSSEFSVVRNEMESGENDPNAILEERMLATAYLWHNYGKTTIGARSDVEGVRAPTLKRFYAKYYQPDNAVLVVAGKFDAAKTLAEITAAFGAVPRPSRTIDPTYTIEPVQDGERIVTLRRVGDVAIVGLMYHTVADSDPDAAASDAVIDILTAEPSGRLYKALVQTGMATRVFSSGFPSHDPGVIEVYASVRADKPLEPVKAKMLEIVEGLAKDKITDEEVARFRAKRKKAAKLLFSNTQVLATQLSEFIGTGDWRLLFLSRDRAVAVTRDQVQRIAATYLKSSNRTLGTFMPEKQSDRAPLTQAPDVAKALETYQGQPPPAEGEVFVYTVDNIEKRTSRGKLANGLAWAMLPKKTRGEVVRARLTLRYGTAKDFAGKVEAAEMLPQLLRRGTRKHTFQQLSDELDLLEANVALVGGPGQVSAIVTATRENLDKTLKLVDEMLRQPSWPAAELEIVRKDRLTQLDEQKSQPEALASNVFQRKVQPKQPTDPQYTPTTEEKIARVKGVSLGDIKQLYGLVGASHAQLTVLGDFDAKAVEQQAGALWGEWKSPRPFKRLDDKFVETAASVEMIDTPDKENALIVAGLAFQMRDDDPDYPAVQIANYVLGGSGFGSRLVARLREKDGLSYGADSFVFVDPFDGIAIFEADAILAPQNAAKGMTAMLEEIERFAKDGMTAQELEDARKGYVKIFDRRLSSDDFVIGQLHQSLYIGRTMDFQAQINAKVAALTLDQVNAAVKKHFVPAKLIRVTGADRKKAEAGAK
jgi:zinc protease